MGKKLKKKKIAIDADYLIFEVAEGKYTQENEFVNEEDGEEAVADLAPYVLRFEQLVDDLVDDVAVELIASYKIKKKVKIIFSDPNGNFRYDIYPEYKEHRKGERSDTFYRLREYLHNKYGYMEGFEADDVVAYYVREKGYIGCSMDKDLLKGVGGIWFDVYHTRRHIVETSDLEARNFTLLQTLMGDPTDNIKGIPRIGEKTAIKLLDEFGWDWKGVVAAYESKGLTEEDAILNRRLVGMDQYHKHGRLKLFEGQK